MSLNGKQKAELHSALLQAFSTRAELAQMVRFGLNLNLEAIAPTEAELGL